MHQNPSQIAIQAHSKETGPAEKNGKIRLDPIRNNVPESEENDRKTLVEASGGIMEIYAAAAQIKDTDPTAETVNDRFRAKESAVKRGIAGRI